MKRSFEEYGKRFYGSLDNLGKLLAIYAIFTLIVFGLNVCGVLGFGYAVVGLVFWIMLSKNLLLCKDYVADEFRIASTAAVVSVVASACQAFYEVGEGVLFQENIFWLVIKLIIEVTLLVGTCVTMISLPKQIGRVFEETDQSIAKNWKKFRYVTIAVTAASILIAGILIVSTEILTENVFLYQLSIVLLGVILAVSLGMLVAAWVLIAKSKRALLAELSGDKEIAQNRTAFVIASLVMIGAFALLIGIRIYCTTVPAKKTLEDAYAGSVYTMSTEHKVDAWDHIGLMDRNNVFPVVTTAEEIRSVLEKENDESTFVLKADRAAMKPVGSSDYANLTWVNFWDYYNELYGDGVLRKKVWQMQDYEITLADGETVYATYSRDMVNQLGEGEITLPVSRVFLWPENIDPIFPDYVYYNHVHPSEGDSIEIHISGNLNDRYNFQKQVETYHLVYHLAAGLVLLLVLGSVIKIVKIKSGDGEFVY